MRVYVIAFHPRDTMLKKVKVAHTRLPSIGFRSWSRFLAVSLQVTWVINPAVGCHFPPGLQLPSQPLRGLLPIFRCLVNRGTMGVSSLPKTVTRQRRDCDLNPGPSAPESSTLTTRLPSHHDTTSGRFCQWPGFRHGVSLTYSLFTAHELNWTDLQHVDPDTRRVHWSRASASRLYFQQGN